MQTFVRITTALLFLTFLPTAPAEEKNGLLVNVTKRTLNRADRREFAYYTRYDRTQGFKLGIKSTSPRAFPEGEINWTIVVKKYSDGLEKYTGTEKLKPLRSSESAEIMVGAVPIQGYRYTRDYKDELEYDISISHAGKETIRLTSTSNFAALAKRANLVRTPEDETAVPTPAPNQGGPATTIPSPAAPQPGQPAVPPAAAPAAPPPQPPPVAPATPAQPNAGQTPAPAAPEGQPFDFFNLNKNKPPKAN